MVVVLSFLGRAPPCLFSVGQVNAARLRLLSGLVQLGQQRGCPFSTALYLWSAKLRGQHASVGWGWQAQEHLHACRLSSSHPMCVLRGSSRRCPQGSAHAHSVLLLWPCPLWASGWLLLGQWQPPSSQPDLVTAHARGSVDVAHHGDVAQTCRPKKPLRPPAGQGRHCWAQEGMA